MTRRQFLQTVKKFSSNQKIAELVKTKGSNQFANMETMDVSKFQLF